MDLVLYSLHVLKRKPEPNATVFFGDSHEKRRRINRLVGLFGSLEHLRKQIFKLFEHVLQHSRFPSVLLVLVKHVNDRESYAWLGNIPNRVQQVTTQLFYLLGSEADYRRLIPF